MFKKLVPVIALALIAGPVVAADQPASTPSDQTTAPAKPHHKKHHKKAAKPAESKPETAPAK
jgi:hypothetical protein